METRLPGCPENPLRALLYWDDVELTAREKRKLEKQMACVVIRLAYAAKELTHKRTYEDILAEARSYFPTTRSIPIECRQCFHVEEKMKRPNRLFLCLIPWKKWLKKDKALIGHSVGSRKKITSALKHICKDFRSIREVREDALKKFFPPRKK